MQSLNVKSVDLLVSLFQYSVPANSVPSQITAMTVLDLSSSSRLWHEAECQYILYFFGSPTIRQEVIYFTGCAISDTQILIFQTAERHPTKNIYQSS